ncbi:redox-sensitive transcriptional regulator HypR [Staphylococcus simulans]
MNLEFNTAIHVLTFLTKHADERFSSKALSELVCINPVQLRRVTGTLVEHGYIDTFRGQHGGYQANHQTAKVNLADLFQLFTEKRTQGRLFTGDAMSHCEISREIGNTMAKHHAKEHELLMQYYRGFTIEEVLRETLTTI